MISSAIPMSKGRETTVRPPTAVPNGNRIYRRPTPPPSQQQPGNSAPEQTPLPMAPRPLLAPPRTESCVAELPRRDSLPWRGVVLLVAATTAIALVAATTAWMWMPESTPDAAETAAANHQTTDPDATHDAEAINQPNAIATATTPTWYADAALEDMLRDEAPLRPPTQRLAGAQLLASRFYELQTDAEGRVIAARIPADNRNRRFGPSIDEVAALCELPRLERLDLRDTIASAAIPIANRLPHVKVLVLEDQTQSGALENLEHLNELHLINSAAAPQSLARRGIRVVHAESR